MQHTFEATTLDGKKAAIAAAMVCKVEDRKIVRFDEYPNSAQVALLVPAHQTE